MNEPHQQIFSVADNRAIDQRAITAHGLPGALLMKRAAAFALEQIQLHWPAVRCLKIYAGVGNNAGDGYWLATLASAAGYSCEVVAIAPPGELSGDAADAWQHWRAADRNPASCGKTLLVDALFGTGLSREIDGAFRAAIDEINASTMPVLAIDIPSGLSAADGNVLGCGVRADLTVAMVALKPGLFLGESGRYTGKIVVSSLGIPKSVYREFKPSLAVLPAPIFVPRATATHKGSYGHVVVVGGGSGMPGAALLAASAALRGGAGKVSVVCAPENRPVISAGQPELMVPAIADDSSLRDLLRSADAIVLGPGLGQDDWAQRCFAAVLATETAAVVDADALTLLAARPQQRANWILTPHPGEAARLLGSDTKVVQSDRLAAVCRLSQRFEAAVVLKGHRSLLASPGAIPKVALGGNPGMATAGSGDVLAGIAGAMLAQQRDPGDALEASVYMHNRAGDRVAARMGERGLLAGDLISELTSC